jgi:16S rRNA (guanine966-N2)-methyltransferase
MRIVAGRLKGRRLVAPRGAAVRPTSDSLRETLFNVLDVPAGARVLDGFAGTGALGLEALSRGARHVTFVDRDPAAMRAIAENVRRCGVENACAIIRGDLTAVRSSSGRPAWAREPFDLIVLDPPYDIENLPAALDAAAALLAPGGQLVLEHRRGREIPGEAPGVRRVRLMTAGDSALSFFASTAPGHAS